MCCLQPRYAVSPLHLQPASARASLGHVANLGCTSNQRLPLPLCFNWFLWSICEAKIIQKIFFITAAIHCSAILCIPFICRGYTKWRRQEDDRWWQGHFIDAVSNWQRRQHSPPGITYLHCN